MVGVVLQLLPGRAASDGRDGRRAVCAEESDACRVVLVCAEESDACREGLVCTEESDLCRVVPVRVCVFVGAEANGVPLLVKDVEEVGNKTVSPELGCL